jgi:FlaA1/EpsC-like NDP-sugar epimerase
MSKAISERLYVDFANKQTDIKVVLCRYGNVMESTGSVIPLFKGLLEAGKTTLPVTDLRMTRFLISLKDSVELINWAYNHPKSHGSIVVPKLKSIKITDLVKELSSMYKIEDLKIDNIGIRPGEKIHEEMVSREESLRAVPYEKYYMITDEIVNSDPMSLDSSTSLLSRAEVGCFLSDNGVTA